MNRLAPLIVRRPRPVYAAITAAPMAVAVADSVSSESLDAVRLFVSSFLGGLIFFSTLFA